MESAMGRITFYIMPEDYEKMLFGGTARVSIGTNTVVQLRIERTGEPEWIREVKGVSVKFFDRDDNLISGRRI